MQGRAHSAAHRGRAGGLAFLGSVSDPHPTAILLVLMLMVALAGNLRSSMLHGLLLPVDALMNLVQLLLGQTLPAEYMGVLTTGADSGMILPALTDKYIIGVVVHLTDGNTRLGLRMCH